uniref:Uncharacterized protein n=1 Tax=Chromera velia CCMP2878 TaxID=1169474 RepID=A0A0G4FZK9_9ALVE|eukprot:Cvel_19519.t1-p1 / transcript=Cvel_19519.t1 / gene=Cvel_19519 / organism=Chromera_velia_CCMP2878 / gene_product=hypothetical protein / transcript_product=hypothetical protein / location=Cvel_scaffold1689:22703-28488(+) / protein_length=354 / sequence_SO=supercontig / SO=protein_coding / is_pseudo=false
MELFDIEGGEAARKRAKADGIRTRREVEALILEFRKHQEAHPQMHARLEACYRSTVKQTDFMAALARDVPRKDSPLEKREECLIWRGFVTKEGRHASVIFNLPETNQSYATHANRVVVFLLGDFENESELAEEGEGPFHMFCDNPRCVRLSHIAYRKKEAKKLKKKREKKERERAEAALALMAEEQENDEEGGEEYDVWGDDEEEGAAADGYEYDEAGGDQKSVAETSEGGGRRKKKKKNKKEDTDRGLEEPEGAEDEGGEKDKKAKKKKEKKSRSRSRGREEVPQPAGEEDAELDMDGAQEEGGDGWVYEYQEEGGKGDVEEGFDGGDAENEERDKKKVKKKKKCSRRKSYVE